MGDLIGLDNAAVMATIEVYYKKEDEQQKMLENVLDLFNIEQEMRNQK